MNKVLIFALLWGRATVLDYGGPLMSPIVMQQAVREGRVKQLSFADAQRIMDKSDPFIMFAPPGGFAIQASESDARAILREWQAYENRKVPLNVRNDFLRRSNAIYKRSNVRSR